MTTAFKGWFGEPLRYGAEQAAPVKVETPAVQQPKPAPVAKDVSPLGLFHPAHEAVKTWQPKGTPAQLLAHLGKHQGAMAHAEASDLHSFLEGKPSVTREEVLGHLGEGKPLQEHEQSGVATKWHVRGPGRQVNGPGRHHEVFDSEEEAYAHLGDRINEHAESWDYDGHPLAIRENTDDWVTDDDQPMSRWDVHEPGDENDIHETFDTEDEANEYAEKKNLEREDKWREEMDRDARSEYSVSEEEHKDSDAHKTHFDTYQLPGPKENYRELHVHAPGIREPEAPLAKASDFDVDVKPVSVGTITTANGEERPVNRQRMVVTMKSNGAVRKFTLKDGETPEEAFNGFLDAHNRQIEAGNKNRDELSWQDGHSEFSHVKNPVVRVRHNDRVDSEGNRVLMMEEMQGPSDANQEKMPGHLRDRIYDIGLKRMLRKAVDGGYDKLAWTTGTQQAERYSLKKHVDSLHWEPVGGGEGNGVLWGDKDKSVAVQKRITEKDLPSYIGEELAAKLLAAPKEEYVPSNGKVHTLRGQDLEVGGHGLASVYDKMLPAKIGKLLKKAGGRVEQSEVPGAISGRKVSHLRDGQYGIVDDNFAMRPDTPIFNDPEQAEEWLANNSHAKVHSIRITPEIAALVKEGFSQYARDGEPERFAAHRAPKGGCTIGGRYFRGGQWLPSDEVANASPATKAAITKGKKARVAARSSRNVDHGTVAAKLKLHAKKLSASEEQAARRSFAALKDHHGELTLHRVEELADETAKAHAQAKGSAKKTLGNRLAQLEWMAGKLSPEVKKDAPAAKAEAKPTAPAKERPTQPVDMQALDQKLRPFQSASIPLDQNDMRFAIATYHELKNEHGDTAMHHLESAANEQLAALNDLPPNAVESRRVHEKKLAAIAWQTHQLRKDGITGDVDDPRHADLNANLDRIRMGEKAREGAHKSPWVAFLCKAIKDVGLTNEDTSIPQVFEDLKAGRFRGQPGLRKALGMLHSDFGTVTPRQLEEILPRVKSVRETL